MRRLDITPEVVYLNEGSIKGDIMESSQKNAFLRISLFAILLMLNSLFYDVLPLGAQQELNGVLANLHTNKKLLAPDDILSDFVNGETETAVIILLQPTPVARVLAERSQLSAQVPAENAGSATYYNLQDESVRAQLQATVTETVARVIGDLEVTEMKVTQKFLYQFGFAAKVTPAALEQILNSPDVIAVEKDHILYSDLAQGIPLINAATVRNSYTGAGLSIAICDSGIDTSHPRLGGGGFPNAKVIGGYDTGDNDADPRPDSLDGSAHGTACAGIAAGNMGTVGDYIGGVAPNSTLYAVKVMSGNSGTALTSALIAGWEWCILHKNDNPKNPIMIISTSLAGGRYSSACDTAVPSLTTAAANAVATGITIFASSGNDGYCNSIAWPACISYVNSVGAVYDANIGRNPESGYVGCIGQSSCVGFTSNCPCITGKCYVDNTTAVDKVPSYSNSAPLLTVFAPANNAYTTDIVGTGGYSTGDYDTSFGGTSAACPYAAGAAAVLQQAAKAKSGYYLTPDEVKAYLVNNGDSVTDNKAAVTKPRINLGKAIDALKPDLTGTWLSCTPICSNTKKGVKCKVKGKINIQNIGRNNAPSSVVRYYLSDNNTYDGGDTTLKQVSSGKLKVGKSTVKTLSFSFQYGVLTAGKYIIAIIDADSTVEETNENNNIIVYGPLPNE
jgi:subtilisin family serine protease